MKVIVCGSRGFSDYDLIKKKLDKLLRKVKDKVTLLSGHAKGADQLGELYAFDRRLPYEIHHADWSTHGKRAGIVRNEEMVKEAGAMIAFWDGKSPGTKDAINRAKKKGVKVIIVLVKE